MKNLSTEHPIDKHLKPVKDSDGNNSALEISTEKVRVKDLEVTGTTIGIESGSSVTVDSSLTDGSTNPVENNAVYDGLATKLNLSGGTMTSHITMPDNGKVIFGDAGELIYGNGTDLFVVSSGAVAQDAIGGFISKNNGTEFSVANSAYAGMILGYTTVGIGQTPAKYDVLASMNPVHDDLKVTFKAPPSGVVEIMVSIYVDTDSARSLTFGLSTTDASTGFTSLHAQYENHTFFGDETDGQQHQHRWVITGLTPNAVDTYWFSAGCTHTGRYDLRWGGDSSSVADGSEPYEYQPFIMKATALPTAVTDYAVYG